MASTNKKNGQAMLSWSLLCASHKQEMSSQSNQLPIMTPKFFVCILHPCTYARLSIQNNSYEINDFERKGYKFFEICNLLSFIEILELKFLLSENFLRFFLFRPESDKCHKHGYNIR